MNEAVKNGLQRFNAQSMRERALIALTLIVALGFVWWNFFALSQVAQVDSKQVANQKIENEVSNSRKMIDQVRLRMSNGVNQLQDEQILRLKGELLKLDERLRIETVELIDPKDMFQLMSELVNRDSKMKLLSLKRREVKPAVADAKVDDAALSTITSEPSLFRHVLEIELSGKYVDLLGYVQTIESLQWKLLWDEIDIVRQSGSNIVVKVVLSTLSTKREWVGI